MTSQFFNPTKKQMIEELNTVLRSFYGGNTTVSRKVAALPKEAIARLHEVAWLWRNDPIAEQVNVLEEHMRFLTSF